ncbi:hypothetical protein Plhal304r1_c062g0148911 [Plasmopara halstedii]
MYERIEIKFFLKLIGSNKKNSVHDKTLQLVLFSLRTGRRESHIFLRHASNRDQAASIRLKIAHADMVEGDVFSSQEFQIWAKCFANAFLDDPKLVD